MDWARGGLTESTDAAIASRFRLAAASSSFACAVAVAVADMRAGSIPNRNHSMRRTFSYKRANMLLRCREQRTRMLYVCHAHICHVECFARPFP